MDSKKLIERLNAYSAEHQQHGGITAEAADAISTFQAENERLRKELEYEREHANAYHKECGQWEAENEKLRAELDEKEKYYDQMIDALAATDSAELEQVKRENSRLKEILHGMEKG